MENKDIFALADDAAEIHEAIADQGFSKDAILIALALRRYGPSRPAQAPWQKVPDALPEWFTQACESLKGQRLTVGQFAMRCGKVGPSKRELNQIGAWLRQSGRHPRKSGGVTAYDI